MTTCWLPIEDQLARYPDLGYVLIGLEGMALAPLSRVLALLDDAGIQYGLVPPVGGVPLLGFQVDQFLGCDFMILQRHRAAARPAVQADRQTLSGCGRRGARSDPSGAGDARDRNRVTSRGRVDPVPLAPARLRWRRLLGPEVPDDAARCRASC